ncbi:MAG: hypothetical protein O2856_14290 [Planctomycetota bacterium]|nr:hypothetical protein [Planctomycetota bacterium]
MIVIAIAAAIINWRGRNNQDPAVDFKPDGAMDAATVAFVAAFGDFFLPVPEPFAMGNQIHSESQIKVL